MVKKKDWCSGWWDKYLNVDISMCCKEHDETLSTTLFFKCLRKKIGVFHATYITLGGAIGAWIKYPFSMLKKL